MAGTGFSSASSGSQTRAASVVPSFNGIKVCSMTRTAFGKFVTITVDHSCGSYATCLFIQPKIKASTL